MNMCVVFNKEHSLHRFNIKYLHSKNTLILRITKTKNQKKTENLTGKTKKIQKKSKTFSTKHHPKKNKKGYTVVCHDTNKVHLYT